MTMTTVEPASDRAARIRAAVAANRTRDIAAQIHREQRTKIIADPDRPTRLPKHLR